MSVDWSDYTQAVDALRKAVKNHYPLEMTDTELDGFVANLSVNQLVRLRKIERVKKILRQFIKKYPNEYIYECTLKICNDLHVCRNTARGYIELALYDIDHER